MEKYRATIEQHAGVMENMGWSPVSSRVYLYLLLCPRHEATFDELLQYFKVSKSAVSNALKFLKTVDIVSAKTKGGQRKRYFRAEFSKLTAIATVIDRYRQLSEMMEDICKVSEREKAYSGEIRRLSLFFKFMIAEYPKLIGRWEDMIRQEQLPE